MVVFIIVFKGEWEEEPAINGRPKGVKEAARRKEKEKELVTRVCLCVCGGGARWKGNCYISWWWTQARGKVGGWQPREIGKEEGEGKGKARGMGWRQERGLHLGKWTDLGRKLVALRGVEKVSAKGEGELLYQLVVDTNEEKGWWMAAQGVWQGGRGRQGEWVGGKRGGHTWGSGPALGRKVVALREVEKAGNKRKERVVSAGGGPKGGEMVAYGSPRRKGKGQFAA